MDPVNLHEYEIAAREKLPGMVWDYYSSGADDEVTLRDNREAYERLKLQYRVLVDVKERDLRTTVLDQPVSMPILIAPTAFQRLAHPDGELATVRAAGAAGTIMILSTLSNRAVEEVVAAATKPVWFQLYVYKDRGVTTELIQRAEAAGCKALVLTVDVPAWGRRERDIHNRFRLPEGITVENLTPNGLQDLPPQADGSGLAAYIKSLFDPTLSWRDIEWLRARTRLPLVLKGLVRADDAVRAVEAGVSGIVVSNHGGRQLDTAPATIDVLPEIAEAVDGRTEILLDGGIRRGTDVVKALALGARAVLVGRPPLWGLAVNGESGAGRVLELLRDELDGAMAMCGCPSTAQITRDLVARSARRAGRAPPA